MSSFPSYVAHTKHLHLVWRAATWSCIVALLLPTTAMGNPLGGVVAQGNAAISQNGNTLNITQSTNRSIINWQSFSINPGEVTNFALPSSSAAVLNRVTGGDPSAIMGTLQSNGQVLLLNPNGILFGKDAVINVGGLVASTLNVNDAQFMAGGNLEFSGSSRAGVTNLGNIRALEGDIYLIGANVANHGILQASNGTVGLAAGQSVLLADSAHPHLVVRATSESIGGTGVHNTGMIQALRAELVANGGNVYALAINNEGVIRANGSETRGGRIYLTSSNGSIESSGDLIARKGQEGGEVHISAGGQAGTKVKVTGLIDVSGVQQGGDISIRAASIDIGSATFLADGEQIGDLRLLLGENTIEVDGGTGVTIGTFSDPSGEEATPPPPLPAPGGNWSNRSQDGVTVDAQFNAMSTETINVASSTDDLTFSGASSITSTTDTDIDSFMITPVSPTLEGFGNIEVEFKIGTAGTATATIEGKKSDGTDFMFDVTFAVTGNGDRSIQFAANAGEAITKVTIAQGTSTIEEIKNLRVNDLFAELPQPEPGILKIIKQTDPDGSTQEFQFKADYLGDGSEVYDFTLIDGQMRSDELAPGVYTVEELLNVEGWFFDMIVIDDPTNDSSANGAVGTANLSMGETVTMTFLNTQGAKIIVEKVVNTISPEDNTEKFSFTSNINDLGNAGDGSFQLSSNNQSPDNMVMAYVRPDQEYTVTEGAVPAGYEFDSHRINNGTPVFNKTATFTPDAGEEIRVTFRNTEQGKIIIDKLVYTTTPGDNTEKFGFSSNIDGLSSFQLSSNNQSPENMTMAFVSPNSEASYMVTEDTIPEGFKFDSVMQMRSPMPETPEILADVAFNGDRTAYISPLRPGETVRVTFKNIELGKIIVEKQTLPGGSDQLFTFVPDYDEVNFQLKDGQANMSPFLMSGMYNVEELVPMNWQLLGINITDPTGGTMRVGNGAKIDLAAGETVRLVFNNVDESVPVIPAFFFRWDPIYPDGVGNGLPFYGPDNRNNANEMAGNSSNNLFQPGE